MKVNFQNVYESIGYLFYALSVRKGKLTSDEYSKLHDIIYQKWEPFFISYHRHLNTYDALQSDLIEHLHSAIKKAHDCEWNALQAFEHFKNYYLEHMLPYNETLKENMMLTSKCIARAFCSNDDPASSVLHEVNQLLGLKPDLSCEYHPDSHIKFSKAARVGSLGQDVMYR
jgi:hypothetical protein